MMRAILHAPRRRRTMDHPRKPCLLVFLTTVVLVLAVLGSCVLADGSKYLGANNATQTPEVGRANVTLKNGVNCAPGHPGWHPPGGNGYGQPGWHPPGGNGYGQPGWHPPGGNGYHQPWTPTPVTQTPQVSNPIRSAAATDHRRGHCAAGFSAFLLGATVSWLLRF